MFGTRVDKLHMDGLVEGFGMTAVCGFIVALFDGPGCDTGTAPWWNVLRFACYFEVATCWDEQQG